MLLLNVPFSQKDDAKALGARWNQAQKKWYVPDHVDPAPFLARPEWTDPDYVPPPQVPGKGPKWPLFVDLIPRTAWFSNLRSELDEDEWKALKRQTFDNAGWVCEVCTCRGPKWPVECHERFEYNEETGIQTLTGTIALCPSCHESTHMGFARTRGRSNEAMAHLMAVNGWSEAQARQPGGCSARSSCPTTPGRRSEGTRKASPRGSSPRSIRRSGTPTRTRGRTTGCSMTSSTSPTDWLRPVPWHGFLLARRLDRGVRPARYKSVGTHHGATTRRKSSCSQPSVSFLES